MRGPTETQLAETQLAEIKPVVIRPATTRDAARLLEIYAYYVDQAKAEEFDKNFPFKEKKKLPGQLNK